MNQTPDTSKEYKNLEVDAIGTTIFGSTSTIFSTGLAKIMAEYGFRDKSVNMFYVLAILSIVVGAYEAIGHGYNAVKGYRGSRKLKTL